MMSMKGSSKSAPEGAQTASCSHTATGSESAFTTTAAALPGGAIGDPLYADISGNVQGIVQIQIGSQAVKEVIPAPNQAPVRVQIPKGSFPNKVNSVNVNFEAFGAGTLAAVITFAPN